MSSVVTPSGSSVSNALDTDEPQREAGLARSRCGQQPAAGKNQTVTSTCKSFWLDAWAMAKTRHNAAAGGTLRNIGGRSAAFKKERLWPVEELPNNFRNNAMGFIATEAVICNFGCGMRSNVLVTVTK